MPRFVSVGECMIEMSGGEDGLYRQLITADEYPELRAAIDAGVFLDTSDPFSFGIARGLDGVATYMAAVAEGRPEPATPWQAAEDADIVADKRFREARKAVREAEKALRDAQKIERQAARDARERLARGRAAG